MSLSPREREVLILAIQGHTVRQIASRLIISTSAVKRYRERILDKLQTSCMENVILRAHRMGVINLDEIEDAFVGSKTN